MNLVALFLSQRQSASDDVLVWLMAAPVWVKTALTVLATIAVLWLVNRLAYKLRWREREPYSYSSAFEKTKFAADNGDAHACYKIAKDYADAKKTGIYNPRLSRYYFNEARWRFLDLSEVGDPFACFMLAEIYRNKLSFSFDQKLWLFVFPWRLKTMYDRQYHRARERYLDRSELATIDSFKNLGILFEEGWGGDRKEPKKALEHYKKAADQGDFQCQHKTADLMSQDNKPDDAVRYYLLAAKNPQGAQGPAKQLQTGIQRYLGEAYESGIGRPVSYEEAYFWYSIAASRGDLVAAANRLRLDTTLTDKTKLAIQNRLKEFHRHLQN